MPSEIKKNDNLVRRHDTNLHSDDKQQETRHSSTHEQHIQEDGSCFQVLTKRTAKISSDMKFEDMDCEIVEPILRNREYSCSELPTRGSK